MFLAGTTAQHSPHFVSDEPIKSFFYPLLLMTDKPLGKLQSDLENERARHSSARLPVIIFRPRKEASRRAQTCINRCRNVCIAAG